MVRVGLLMLCLIWCVVSLILFQRAFFVDEHIQCLLSATDGFGRVSVPFFLAFDTARMWHRSRSLISDNVHVGLYIDDMPEDTLISSLEQEGFSLIRSNGFIDWGQEWILRCPQSAVLFRISVFYPEGEEYVWCSTHDTQCQSFHLEQCRWRFRPFSTEILLLTQQTFEIVPQEFLEEHYGLEWREERNWSSIDSLKNVIIEYQ